jgi:UDP-N-acetylmuramoylalanine-D-glutamate ligase
LEFVKKVKFVEFFNDTASTSSESTESAIRSLSGDKKLVLIFGGSDCGSDYGQLYSVMPKYVKSLVLLPGSGTIKERQKISAIDGMQISSAPSLEDAVIMSMGMSEKGDKVLFSPGFDAGGLDKSREERGKRFVSAVRAIK